MLNKIKTFLTRLCCFYTVLVTAVYFLGIAIRPSWFPSPHTILALLLFSAILSAGHAFLFSDQLVFPLRLLLHYAGTTLLFYIIFVVFMRWSGYQAQGGSVLIVLLVYTFAYILCTALAFGLRNLTGDISAGQSNPDKKEYTSLFDKKDGKRS